MVRCVFEKVTDVWCTIVDGDDVKFRDPTIENLMATIDVHDSQNLHVRKWMTSERSSDNFVAMYIENPFEVSTSGDIAVRSPT